MSKTHRPYAPEYRRRLAELVRAGRAPGELAREFERSAQANRNWVRQTDRDEGRREDGRARRAVTASTREPSASRRAREIKNGPRRRRPARMETWQVV